MRRDEALLLDILIAARRALKYMQGVSREDFEKNEMLQDAVTRPLEIIGEAAGQVSEDYREAHMEIPWHKMTGMRNRLIHEYFRVNYGAVWDTVRNDLPELIQLLEKLVPPE
jgi:uncharacterized protein with HEPN domain